MKSFTKFFVLAFVMFLGTSMLFAQVAEDNYVLGNDGYDMVEDMGVETPVEPALGRAIGDDATNPIMLTWPAMLPWVDANQTTCDRGNNYGRETCLYFYADGQEIVYQITVTEPIRVDFEFTNNSTDYKGNWGIGIFYEDILGPCAYTMALSGSNSYFWGATPIYLNTGTYYMMVDDDNMSQCFTDFTISFETNTTPAPAAVMPPFVEDFEAQTTVSGFVNNDMASGSIKDYYPDYNSDGGIRPPEVGMYCNVRRWCKLLGIYCSSN